MLFGLMCNLIFIDQILSFQCKEELFQPLDILFKNGNVLFYEENQRKGMISIAQNN